MSNEQEDILEMTTADLCASVMKYEGKSMQEALHMVYLSQLYKKMQIPESQLYRESALYLYDLLCEERGIKNVADHVAKDVGLRVRRRGARL